MRRLMLVCQMRGGPAEKVLQVSGCKEEVRFNFPNDFPSSPPHVSLRRDFNRNLPHMLPYLLSGRPVPCIYDGDIAEFLHQAGLVGILNQVSVWLDRAATAYPYGSRTRVGTRPSRYV